MGRKHKVVNKSGIPDWALERFVRCIYDDVVAAYQDPEFHREYEEWEAEQKKKKLSKKPIQKDTNE